LANEHYLELETELGNEQPAPLFEEVVISEAEYKK
jgi:hypothetical protein